jgi:hypothetical protein
MKLLREIGKLIGDGRLLVTALVAFCYNQDVCLALRGLECLVFHCESFGKRIYEFGWGSYLGNGANLWYSKRTAISSNTGLVRSMVLSAAAVI